MMRLSPISLIVVAALTLTACYRPVDSSFYNRGGPESRLDLSSEVVNLSVAGPQEVAQLTHWIEQDEPSRAELYCNGGEPQCDYARKTLDAHGVAVMMVPSFDNSVALVYERILARDCNPRYYDNARHNNYGTNHAAFGCSISANIVQHVSDKQELVNPAIQDPARATGAVTAYDRASTKKSDGDTSRSAIDSIR
jgi:hypothetical protein